MIRLMVMIMLTGERIQNIMKKMRLITIAMILYQPTKKKKQ